MYQRIILILLIILLLIASELSGQNPNFSYPYNYSKIVYVSRVIDGDTFVLSDSSKVRMLGVDCPEAAKFTKPAEPFAEQSTALIKSLIENKTVKLTFDGKAFDMFGRQLAYVWLRNTKGEDSLFINAELLKKGFARISYYPNGKRYYALFYNLRNTARQKRLGIWSNE